MNVYDCAHSLARALKDSEELMAFKSLHQELMAIDSTKKMITDFQTRQFELQTAQLSGAPLDNAKMDKIKELYEVLCRDPKVKDYFQAEMRFGQIMSDISKIITDAVELDK